MSVHLFSEMCWNCSSTASLKPLEGSAAISKTCYSTATLSHSKCISITFYAFFTSCMLENIPIRLKKLQSLGWDFWWLGCYGCKDTQNDYHPLRASGKLSTWFGDKANFPVYTKCHRPCFYKLFPLITILTADIVAFSIECLYLK